MLSFVFTITVNICYILSAINEYYWFEHDKSSAIDYKYITYAGKVVPVRN
jgi:hypothetical protein